MLAPRPDPMSIEAFLDWVERQDNRHELVDGLPVRMMAGAKQSHNVVVGNLADAMRMAAKAAGCRTTSSDTAVVTDVGGVRYPDIVVDCGAPDPDARAAASPVILVEVLSPSTSQIDFSDKLDAYFRHPNVEMILLVDPDVVSVKAYRRAADRSWETERYDDLGQRIVLPVIDASVSLATIYDTLSPKARPPIVVVGQGEPTG